MFDISDINIDLGMSLAHMCLCGTSLWSLKQITKENPWAYGVYSFLAAHGALGILASSEGRIFDSTILQNSTFLAEIIPLPFINTELYMSQSSKDVAHAHCVASAIPIALKFLANEENTDIINIIIGGNMASLLYFSIANKNIWGLILAINQFVFARIITVSYEPKFHLFAIGMAFFNIFSAKAISLSKNQSRRYF